MNFKELGEQIGLDEEEYQELAELFLDTGRVDFDELKTALADADADEVSRRAHTLSGASGNLGMMGIHEVAKRIEMAAINHQLDSVPADVDALDGLFDEIAAAVCP